MKTFHRVSSGRYLSHDGLTLILRIGRKWLVTHGENYKTFRAERFTLRDATGIALALRDAWIHDDNQRKAADERSKKIHGR